MSLNEWEGVYFFVRVQGGDPVLNGGGGGGGGGGFFFF